MNREHEFRGFDGTKWYYGDLEYNRKTDVARIHTYKDDGSYCRQYAVDPDTVGQFTGMCDKNGVKIFEGDIIRFVNGQKKVNEEWVDAEFVYTVEYSEGAFRGVSGLSKVLDAIDVIGNIYDNPELLPTK
jgi:uncharacterized phage protein (TIGR01671 family)